MAETYTLDVSGNTNLKGNLYCYFDATLNKSLYINDNFYINTENGNALQYFSPDQHVFLDTSNNELFRTMISYTATYNKHIFNNNVGIGTYDPSGALHVTSGNSIFNNNVGIGTLDPSYNLQVVGTTLLNGATTITNNTTPSFTSGTLILKKTTSNDVSSIVFPSNKTNNTDYSSIEYYDDVYGTNLNYFGSLSSDEQGCLFINCQNDGNDVSRLLQDNIVIRPVANLILDAGNYSVDASGSIVQNTSGAIFMVPNSGNVGIGTLTPSSKLHVIGDVSISSNVHCTFINDSYFYLYSDTNYMNVLNGNTMQFFTPAAFKFYINSTPLFSIDASSTTITNNTTPSASTGTLILNKMVAGGVSSIVFPSQTNNNSDYGSIEYYDDVYGTNLNYFPSDLDEQSCLFINCQNDGNDTITKYQDNIVIRPVANLILDAGNYSVDASGSIVQNTSGAIFMVPNSGSVSIGEIAPPTGYKLYVNGPVAMSDILGVNSLYSTNSISFGGDLNLNSSTPTPISLSQNELSYLDGTISNIQSQLDSKLSSNIVQLQSQTTETLTLALPLPNVVVVDCSLVVGGPKGTRYLVLPAISNDNNGIQVTIRLIGLYGDILVISCNGGSSINTLNIGDTGLIYTFTLDISTTQISITLFAYNGDWYEI
jgi:hypothetical protein